jgi:hypothetical protein
MLGRAALVTLGNAYGTLGPVGTELVLDGDSDPIFEVNDDLEFVIDQIGGWTHIQEQSQAENDYGGFIVPAAGLGQMADSCEVLAEQYGDEARVFVYERPSSFDEDAPGAKRVLPVTGPELGRCLQEMANAVRRAVPLGRSLRVNGAYEGW